MSVEAITHAGKTRDIAPPEDVDELMMVKPVECKSCSGPLTGDDRAPRVHQVIDIPPINPKIVEYRLHQLTCVKCGAATTAPLPDGVHQSNFGPHLTALVVLLSGEHRMSRRSIQRFISDFHGIDLSLGAISNIEGRMTEGLAESHAEAIDSVAASATKHLDETSWRESNGLAWMWVAVGEEATVFAIRDSRGSAVARELIGDEPSGIVITDRYSGYRYIDLDRRQVCLAHLIRDFRRMAEGEKDLRGVRRRVTLADRRGVPPLAFTSRRGNRSRNAEAMVAKPSRPHDATLGRRSGEHRLRDAQHVPRDPGDGTGDMDLHRTRGHRANEQCR